MRCAICIRHSYDCVKKRLCISNETDSEEDQRIGLRVWRLWWYFLKGEGWGISLLSISASPGLETSDPVLHLIPSTAWRVRSKRRAGQKIRRSELNRETTGREGQRGNNLRKWRQHGVRNVLWEAAVSTCTYKRGSPSAILLQRIVCLHFVLFRSQQHIFTTKYFKNKRLQIQVQTMYLSGGCIYDATCVDIIRYRW